MIEAIIEEYCIIDGLPLDESPIYQFHHWVWRGDERCKCLVGEALIPITHPPPTGDSHGRHSRTSA